jgi:hypothetical protein
MHHTLKIEDSYYDAKVAGDKPFEIRYNDRGFQKGDTVSFTGTSSYKTQRKGTWEITYVTAFSQKDGWVVFGDRWLGYGLRGEE